MMADGQRSDSSADAAAWGERLAAAYREIGERAMRDLPIYNDALGVEAVGFRSFDGAIIGIMVTPWFMNVVMPAQHVSWKASGSRLQLSLPAGDIEFVLGKVDPVGRIASCSLFSPMFAFADMAAVRATAAAALAELMRQPPRDKTVRRSEFATSAIDRRNLLGGVLVERRQ